MFYEEEKKFAWCLRIWHKNFTRSNLPRINFSAVHREVAGNRREWRVKEQKQRSTMWKLFWRKKSHLFHRQNDPCCAILELVNSSHCATSVFEFLKEKFRGWVISRRQFLSCRSQPRWLPLMWVAPQKNGFYWKPWFNRFSYPLCVQSTIIVRWTNSFGNFTSIRH